MAAKHDSHLTLDDVFWVVYHHEEPGPEKLRLFRVLLESCERCRESCPGLLEVMNSGKLPANLIYHDLHRIYGEHQAQKVWQRVQGQALELLRQRLKKEPATYPLAALLAQEGRQQASIDIDRALLLGEAAVEMARRLPVFPPNPKEGLDHRALDAEAKAEMLAWCHAVLANAYRKHLRYVEAAQTFQQARTFLEEAEPGEGLWMGRARVYSMQASLWMDIRQLDDAIESLEEAQAAIPAGQDPEAVRLRAGVGIKLSIVLGLANRHGEAAAVLLPIQRQERLLSPRLSFALAHRVAEERLWSGDWASARSELMRVKVLLKEGGRFADDLRVQWLEKRIQAAEGEFEAALGGFRTLQQDFLKDGLLHEAGSLALEIAGVLLALEEPEQTEVHALEALEVFSALRVKDEMLGALTLLLQGARRGRLTQELVAALLRYANGGRAPEKEAWW